MSFDFVAYAVIFLFLWITSFLWHELGHILGAGTLHGTITVDGLSMSAIPANLWAGGFFSGAVYAATGGLVWVIGQHVVAWLFFTVAVVQLVYATYEGIILPVQGGDTSEYKLGRLTIYLCVTTAMLLLGVLIL